MGVRLNGARVLLTGASSGIGWAMAEQLAPRAKALALVARRVERLEELRDKLRAVNSALEVEVLPCDLTDSAARAALCAKVDELWGCPDVLINNAGLGDAGLFELSPLAKQRRMIELNCTALVDLTHHFLPGMVARGSGGILQVSSGFGLAWLPMFATYVGTKHFVTGFTECLRLEVLGQGVTVSQLCPGPVATEFEQHVENPFGMSPPGFLQISSEKCARQALRGFEKGRAMILPGFVNRVMMFFTGLSPRWMNRLVLGLSVPRFRKKELAFRSAQKAAPTEEGSQT